MPEEGARQTDRPARRPSQHSLAPLQQSYRIPGGGQRLAAPEGAAGLEWNLARWRGAGAAGRMGGIPSSTQHQLKMIDWTGK